MICTIILITLLLNIDLSIIGFKKEIL